MGYLGTTFVSYTFCAGAYQRWSGSPEPWQPLDPSFSFICHVYQDSWFLFPNYFSTLFVLDYFYPLNVCINLFC